MKINCFSVTFWFNIFDKHSDMLNLLQEEMKDEYSKFNIFNYTDNLVAPIITAINNKKMTNISFSQINFQYNMDKVSLDDFDIFQEKVLKLFDILIENDIEVAHSAIFVNGEIIDDEALKTITQNTIKSEICDDDLVDLTLKVGKKHEDLFYKIITILNKKQIKLPQKIDKNGKIVPIPLISWNGALVENEIIDISYEINDKYLFDFTKNYKTTEFHINKMLYILKEDMQNDIVSILKNGNF